MGRTRERVRVVHTPRIDIKCPNAVSTTTPAVACDAEADFLFEQCTQ
jgi:hypothetical protein